MREPSEHTAYVDTWFDGLPENLSPRHLVSAFEQTFTALWRRAQRTLGDVTVSAIVDRVLHEASARYPLFGALKVEGGIGLQFGELRQRVRPEDAEQLREGMRAMLIQFLTVMGNLTADILTPALHVELSGVRVEDLTTFKDRQLQHQAEQEGESEATQ
jgi:hypothetical protein